MNEQSLDRVNAFLAAAAARVQPGEVLDATPAEIGRALEFPDALSTARAVRALIARRRLEPADGSYRLLDARPVESGEKEAIGRRPRKRRDAGRGGTHGTRAAGDSGRRAGGGPAYSDLGRAAVDRLIDLGREVATLRASLRGAREEARESREARLDAERRAGSLVARVHDLEQRAEMAESNLRTLLASARGGTQKDAHVADSEMEAILGVLKGGDEDVGAEGRASDMEQGGDSAGETLMGDDEVADAAGSVGAFVRPAAAPDG
jgi:hypothetical protein